MEKEACRTEQELCESSGGTSGMKGDASQIFTPEGYSGHSLGLL